MRGPARAALLLAVGLAAGARAESTHPEHRWLRFGALAPPTGAELPPVDGATAAGHPSEELLRRFSMHLTARGDVEERERRVTRFLTPEGVQSEGNLEIPARALHDLLWIEEAWIQDADGSRRTVAPATIQVRPDDDPHVFSDVYDVVVPLPGVAVGSTAVLQTRRLFQAGEWPLPWARIVLLRTLTPLRRIEVTLSWEAGVQEPAWASDDPDFSCTRSGEREVSCEGGPFEAFPLDPDLDPWLDHVPTFAAAEPIGWQDLARDYGALVNAASKPDAAIFALAEELRSPSGDVEETLRSFHRFVADRVRYVGLEHGVAAVEPEPARRVLERRYGDCKDQVVLFLALARAAGIPAHAALVTTDLSMPERLLLPAWRWFDHMIACATPFDRQPLCVDPTAAGFPSGRLPASVQGRVALDLRSDASAPRTLASEPYAFEVEIRSDTEIRCDGSLREELIRRFPGSWGAMLRGHLLTLPDAERTAWLQNEYQDLFGAHLRPAFTVEGLHDPDVALELRSTTDFPRAGETKRLDRYTEMSPWLRHYTGYARTRNRHHPHRFSGMRISEIARFRPCAGGEVAFVGPTLDFYARFGALRRHYERAPHGVDVATLLTLESGRFDGDERAARNRFLDRLHDQSRLWFTMRYDTAGRDSSEGGSQ